MKLKVPFDAIPKDFWTAIRETFAHEMASKAWYVNQYPEVAVGDEFGLPIQFLENSKTSHPIRLCLMPKVV